MTIRTGPFRLETFLAAERESVEAALGRVLEQILPELPDALREPVYHGVLAGGKRIRPILCVTARSACMSRSSGSPDQVEAAYDLAASLELIHAYSLMHDDLPCMDDAALRRGVPTPHTVFGEPTTMRAGLVLIPVSARHAWKSAHRLGLSPERCRSIIRILSRAAGAEGMVGGQALDLLAEERVLTRRELDDLHIRKTGALLTAAAQIGAVAAAASPQVEEALVRYGDAIGLAFQIADDILDATGDATILGKHPSDTELGKSTYVRLLGVDAAREEADDLIRQALGALDSEGIRSEALEALARYMIGRVS